MRVSEFIFYASGGAEPGSSKQHGMLALICRSLIHRIVEFETLAEFFVRHGPMALFAAVCNEDDLAAGPPESEPPNEERMTCDKDDIVEGTQEPEPFIEEQTIYDEDDIAEGLQETEPPNEEQESNNIRDQSYKPSVDGSKEGRSDCQQTHEDLLYGFHIDRIQQLHEQLLAVDILYAREIARVHEALIVYDDDDGDEEVSQYPRVRAMHRYIRGGNLETFSTDSIVLTDFSNS